MRDGGHETQQEASTLAVGTDFEIQAPLDAMASGLSDLQGSNGEQRSRLLCEKLTGKL
jgi:hypothetical protein